MFRGEGPDLALIGTGRKVPALSWPAGLSMRDTNNLSEIAFSARASRNPSSFTRLSYYSAATQSSKGDLEKHGTRAATLSKHLYACAVMRRNMRGRIQNGTGG